MSDTEDALESALNSLMADAVKSGRVKVMSGNLGGGNRKMLKGSDLNIEVQIERLRDHYTDIAKTHVFKPGDVVQFKDGLNGQWSVPGPGQPAIVSKVFDPPQLDPHATSGSTSFLRAFDVAILVLDTDGDLVEFAFDSRYFEPHPKA